MDRSPRNEGEEMMSLISSQTYMTDFIMWSPKEEIFKKCVAKSLVLDAICFFSTTTNHMSSFFVVVLFGFWKFTMSCRTENYNIFLG